MAQIFPRETRNYFQTPSRSKPHEGLAANLQKNDFGDSTSFRRRFAAEIWAMPEGGPPLLFAVAADFEVLAGFEDFAGVEGVFEFGEEGVAFDFAVDAGEEEFGAAGQEGGVELGSADDVELPAVGGFCDGVEGAEDGDSGDVGFAGDDPIFAAGERPAEGVVGFSSHDDDVAESCAFEKFQILGDMPRDAAIDSDDAVEGHGGDGDHGLDGDGSFYCGVRVIAFESEVLEDEILEAGAGGVEHHAWQGAALAGKLQAGLLEVVRVEMEVAKGVNKCSGLKTADLRDHEREEGVRGNIERHSEEEIGAALIELATEFAVLDIELKQRMAWCEGHEMQLGGVPGRNDEAAAVGIFFDVFDDAGDLIDGGAIRSAPVAPLRSIDSAEVAIRIGPFIPDGDIVFPQVADVCLAFQEPEQLVDDGAEVEFFRGEEGKSLAKIEALLGTENRIGASAGAVGFESTLVEDKAKEAVVLLHGVGERMTGWARERQAFAATGDGYSDGGLFLRRGADVAEFAVRAIRLAGGAAAASVEDEPVAEKGPRVAGKEFD